ncbi:CPBP family intramembrane glutamic endopeptidase [Salinibacter sp.]|uniref:CPBP family intramembrane glutamic endopeptidase n=1 Tax=Salinibacter sp. TaxID=2065818 RepID=UPI0021E8DCB3|nr:CPBP family intramembrane glutamic endopeptidase [Salinibacter sp.]
MGLLSNDSSASAPASTSDTALDRIRVRHLALWAVCALFGAAGLLIASGLEVGPDISERMLGMGLIGGTMVGWLGQALWRQGLDLSALFGPLPSSPSAWGTVLVGVLALDLLNSAEFHLLVPWLEQVAPRLADRYVMNAVETPTGTREYLRLIGSGVIAAPLVEEVLFRGVVYQRWAYAWNRPALALGAAAVPFALLHGHVLGAFVFAGVTTLLYVYTRSLWAPIAMHALGNANALFGGLPVEAGFELITGGAGDGVFGGVSLVASGVLLVGLLGRCGGALYEPLPYVEHEDERRTAPASPTRNP